MEEVNISRILRNLLGNNKLITDKKSKNREYFLDELYQEWNNITWNDYSQMLSFEDYVRQKTGKTIEQIKKGE